MSNDTDDTDDTDDTTDAGIVLEGTEFTVSANETVSTGDYESFEAFASVSGEIPDVALDDDGREGVRRQLSYLQEDLRVLVQQGARSRLQEADRREEP